MPETLLEPAPRLVRDGVYERIRDEILCCALRPGSQLQERDLAQRFDVSKSPVRDALLRLEEQNLIDVLPRKGYRVKPISVTDARELYEMRMILERSCVTRLIDHASDAELESLDRFRRAGTQKSLPAWIEYNRGFHLAIAEACGNARLERAAREVIEQFDRLTYMSVSSSEAGGLRRFVDEHCAIIDAIQKRDKRQAAALVREHVESSRKRLLESIATLAVVP